jgi:hypothetical protein
MKLLAHELTHVIQQESGEVNTIQKDDADPESHPKELEEIDRSVKAAIKLIYVRKGRKCNPEWIWLVSCIHDKIPLDLCFF